jgi:hypothetical protein
MCCATVAFLLYGYRNELIRGGWDGIEGWDCYITVCVACNEKDQKNPLAGDQREVRVTSYL